MINQWQLETIDGNSNLFINNLLSYFKETKNKDYLLDLNNKNKNYIESFILKTVLFHFKRLNLIFDENIHYIEFGFNKKSNDFTLTPILTSITYLNDSSNLTAITNLTIDSYKYKMFDDINICLSYSNKLKHITFDGNLFHYNIIEDNDECCNIVINILDYKPENVFYYYNKNIVNNNTLLSSEPDIDIVFNEINKNKTIILDDENYKFENVEQMIYNKNTLIFSKLIDEQYFKEFNTFYFEKEERNISEIFKNKDYNNSRIDINIQKYFQRFIIEKIFQTEICNWIINESEKYAENNGGWMKNRHPLYPTNDLPIEKIGNISSFILHSFENIIEKIKKYYCLNETHLFEIDDLFIVKYDINLQTSLEEHTDQSDLTVNILLNNSNDFEGGGTQFDDDIIIKLNQGDMLIHSGNVKHSGLPITKGKRYLLVLFLKIFL